MDTATPLKGMDARELEGLERRFRTTLVNSLSGFKALHLLGTANEKGQTNLSVVNSVVHVGAHPPLLGMVIRPHTVPRHSLENLLATGSYTLNQVSEDFFPRAHQCAARYPEGVSEFEEVGLTPWYAEGFSAPFVAESRVRLGLRFQEKHLLGNECVFVVGKIEHIWLPADCLGTDGYVDLAAAGTLTVAGLDAYHRTEPLGRMAYAKPDVPPRFLEK